MCALTHVSTTHFCCGNYTTASARSGDPGRYSRMTL
jgi:hypothetical protein